MLRSITELCVADHHNNREILTRWLSNKTPEHFRSWLTHPGFSLLVAIDEDKIVAVGSVTDRGRITLNYVSPDARFRGVSRALIAALEARAVHWGNMSCALHSTATARRFYLANGYSEIGEPVTDLGMISYPMVKSVGTRLPRWLVSQGSD
jgi:GNAT superfamily N-acetyltransferase